MTPGGLRARLASGGGALLLACAWLAATSWLRPLMLPDEGRYAGIAWEMLRSGDWLVPTLDGLPFFHKPPLFYWLTAASLSAFGMNEWAARVASLLGAAAAATALYCFAHRWCGATSARLCLLALVTQPLVFIGAQFANLDMLVAGCIAVTILALAHATLRIEQGFTARGALAAAYLFAALGLLAKGLIGAVLPALVILVWLVTMGRLRVLRSLLWIPGIALFLVVAAPWFIAMQWRFPEFTDYFFRVQHFQRFTGGGFNNAQPFWFFPVAIALLAAPWSAWLAWSVWSRAAASRRESDPQHGALHLLMWLWLAVVTLFFSLPESKLVGYVLPVTVPLAFLVGDSARRALPDSAILRRLWVLGAAVALAACLAAVALATAYPGKSLRSLGLVLAGNVGPEDEVVFLHDYYFDIPFYARLRAPVRVVEDWDSQAVKERDNWSRELRDAQRFASPGAARVLITPADLAETIHRSRTTWVLGYWTRDQSTPALAGAQAVARSGETALWRIPGGTAPGVSEVGSPQTPIANSGGKS